MDYARAHRVPHMPPITEGDLTKPVLKKFWTTRPSGNAQEYSSQITKIVMSKFAILENHFRGRSVDAVILPVPAIPETPPGGEEEEPYTHAERPPPNSRDGFSGSEYVFSLSQCNFRNFLDRKDIAVVMFYGDENDDKTMWARMQLNKAARATQRINHGYAAINCAQQWELCQTLGACTLPMFKMYSRGNILSTIREVCTFNSDILKRFVEAIPILPKDNTKK